MKVVCRIEILALYPIGAIESERDFLQLPGETVDDSESLTDELREGGEAEFTSFLRTEKDEAANMSGEFGGLDGKEDGVLGGELLHFGFLVLSEV
jgi:hypothetical protein